jgi:hypothetical protein
MIGRKEMRIDNQEMKIRDYLYSSSIWQKKRKMRVDGREFKFKIKSGFGEKFELMEMGQDGQELGGWIARFTPKWSLGFKGRIEVCEGEQLLVDGSTTRLMDRVLVGFVIVYLERQTEKNRKLAMNGAKSTVGN